MIAILPAFGVYLCDKNQALYPQLNKVTPIRCHRSFLVNAKKIEAVYAAGNGYTLELDSGNSKVPLSKTYVNNLKSWVSI